MPSTSAQPEAVLLGYEYQYHRGNKSGAGPECGVDSILMNGGDVAPIS